MPTHILVESLPALEGHSAALAGDYMVVYGGKTSSHALNGLVFALNLTSHEWFRLTCGGQEPPPRCYHSVVMFGWQYIVFGGLLAVGVDDIHYNLFNVFANPDALDSSVLQCRGRERLRDPRSLRQITQQRKETCSLYCLDLENKAQWLEMAAGGCIPPTRAHHAAVVHRSTMYIFGGYSVHTTARPTDEELKALHVVYGLNLHNRIWTAVDTVESVPPKLWGMSAVLASGVWVMFGGVDIVQCKEENAVCAWHMDRGEWGWLTPASGGPSRRAMHSAVRWGDKMFVFGGSTDVSSVLFNDLWALDLINGTWTQVATKGSPPLPRSNHSALVVGQMMYVCGGLDAAFERSHRVWSLSFETFQWETVSCSFSVDDLDNVIGMHPTARIERDPIQVVDVQRSYRNEEVQTAPHLGSEDVTDLMPKKTGLSLAEIQAMKREIPMERLESDQRQVAFAPMDLTSKPDKYEPTNPSNRVYQYPVAWADDDTVLHSMRTGIAKSKTIMGNMLEAAAARSARSAPVHDPAVPPHVVSGSQTEASTHLSKEIEARTARLKELAEAHDAPSQVKVQQYWEHELSVLSRENELWKQGVEREYAIAKEYERRSGVTSGTPRRMDLSDELNSSRAQFDVLSQRHNAVMTPYASPSALSAKLRSGEDKGGAIKYRPKKNKEFYVSPSIRSLGLTMSLGQTRHQTAARSGTLNSQLGEHSREDLSRSSAPPLSNPEQQHLPPSAIPTTQHTYRGVDDVAPIFPTVSVNDGQGTSEMLPIGNDGRLPSATDRYKELQGLARH